MAKNCLYIMCGLPRSGKSTWIKRNKGDAIIVSPDEIRANIFGHQFFKAAEGFVWAFTKGMVRMLLKQDKNVIVDATHITNQSRQTWVSLAKEYDARVKLVWVKTSVKKCLERNEKSPEGQKLPEDVIKRMAMTFENPSTDFGFDDIIQHPKSKRQEDVPAYCNYYQREMLKIINDGTS